MPYMRFRSAGILLLVTASLFALSGAAHAASYDRYGTVYTSKKPTSSSQASWEFLSYPLELIRWPADRTLNLIEDKKLDKKAKWIIEEIHRRGIYPHAGYNGDFSAGTKLDFIQMINQKVNYPDLILKGHVAYEQDESFKAGTEFGWHDLSKTGLGVKGVFNYSKRPEEDFYGIGPDTTRGDGSTYKIEETELGAVFLYQPSPAFRSHFKVAYRNINITDGEDDGKNIIDRQFPLGSIPGLDGDELLDLELDFVHDTRNHKTLSTRGGMRRFGIGFHEGLDDSNAQYVKYILELSQYFALGNERRVLMVHFYGEHNDELNGDVPFHQMARLGGMGVSDESTSRTLRGYDYNRFFGESSLLLNIEYRYTIWEYRDFKLDAVLFFDEGQVFNEYSKFQFKDFNESYGVGFRLSAANTLLLDFEIAHGDEGTNFYAKTKTAF